MKLVYAKPSPFVRKVMVILEEAGQAANVELVDGFGSPTAPNADAIASNPLGKIPSLQLDDGTSIYDSRVITRYLDDQFKLGLYPSDKRAFSTLTLEAHADAILDACILCVYEVRCRDESIHSKEWLDAQRNKIARAVSALESHWMPHLQTADKALDIGHIGVGCALEYLDFRQEMGAWPEWRAKHPTLDQWGKEFSKRASMQATVPA